VTGDPTLPVAPVQAGEEAAWADLRACWGDPLAHRAYLARFADLEGLARAGARYRAAIESAPDDPVAAAGRDEVLRKAALLGLAAIPRTIPPEPGSPWMKRGVVAALVILGIGMAAWAALSMLRAGAGR
jgi:hypothetical protein